MEKIIHKELGYKLLGLAYDVHNILGPGLLEHAYQAAYCIELRRAGVPFECQKPFTLHYRDEVIGLYKADIVIDNTVILEIKSVVALVPAMEAQVINYLKISRIPVGYLLNFNGAKVEWKRFVGKRE